MNLYPYVNYQEKLVDAKTVPFPYDDFGFLYGYGLFETVRILDKKPLFMDKHWERLTNSAIIIGIEVPFRYSELVRYVDELIEANDVSEAVLNIYLTAGDRPVGTPRIVLGTPTILMVLRPLMHLKSNVGIYLGIRQESFQRIELDRFKMLSYIKNVLEKALCDSFDDVLLYSEHEDLLETPTANVFLVDDKTLVTPKSPYILPGVTRQYILDSAAKMGYTAVEKELRVSDLIHFNEIFLTSSLKGVVLVDNMELYPTLKSGKRSRDIQMKYNESLGIKTPPESVNVSQ